MTTVRELEALLLDAFPAKDATPSDRIGLLVGDAEAKVGAIAIALDAKVATIEAAAAEGCTVLVTHHAPFWYPPTEFLRSGPSEGAAIYRAAQLGVALIAMHTNLDCAPVAREMLLEPAGFAYTAPLALPGEMDSQLRLPLDQSGARFTATDALDPLSCACHSEGSAGARGNPESPESETQQRAIPSLGQLGRPREGEAVRLAELAECYREAFGLVAKVWGDPAKSVGLLATCSGGGGSLVQRIISTGADCYVTGEVAYHEALELAAADVALIELGHDRSELPYRFFLRDALLAAGFTEEDVRVLGPTTTWWH